MNKKVAILLVALYCFFQNPVHANEYIEANQDEGMNASALYKNQVKLNLTSLAFSTVSLQYERVIGSKTTVALGIRFRPASSLPFKKYIVEQIEDDSEVETFINDIRLGGFAFTPEFRYYLGKGAGKGFYVAPFARYETHTIKSTYLLSLDDRPESLVPFKGNLSSMGIGL